MFKKVAPHIPMPPKPIVTRWGTWLTAGNYYCEFLDEFILVLNELDVEDANSIKICTNLVENAEIKNDLAFINANFGDLPNLITIMETIHLSLYDEIANYEHILEYICNMSGEIENKIKVKF